MNTNEPKHPPLNTPLSAFTPAMLDALPVGSAFGPGEEVSGVMVKDDRGWRPAAGGRYAPDFGAPGWDQTRPLIRVGPEQASETERDATLPDPWPGMVADLDDGVKRHRARIASVYIIGDRVWVWVEVGDSQRDLPWSVSSVHEVRTPDGTTLWKRPAGGAS